MTEYFGQIQEKDIIFVQDKRGNGTQRRPSIGLRGTISPHKNDPKRKRGRADQPQPQDNSFERWGLRGTIQESTELLQEKDQRLINEALLALEVFLFQSKKIPGDVEKFLTLYNKKFQELTPTSKATLQINIESYIYGLYGLQSIAFLGYLREVLQYDGNEIIVKMHASNISQFFKLRGSIVPTKDKTLHAGQVLTAHVYRRFQRNAFQAQVMNTTPIVSPNLNYTEAEREWIQSEVVRFLIESLGREEYRKEIVFFIYRNAEITIGTIDGKPFKIKFQSLRQSLKELLRFTLSGKEDIPI